VRPAESRPIAARRRVIVTGAGGWLGRSVVTALSASESLQVSGLTRADLDLAVPGAFDNVIGTGASTTLVHLAASLNRAPTPEADARQWQDTFSAGREVILASVARGVDHLLVAGSMDELGDAEGVLARDLPSRPRSTYGLCKVLLRQVAEFEASRTPVLVDWFRPTIVFGPGQRGTMLVPQALAAASKGEELAVTDGAQRRDFLFVDDLVEWLRSAIEQGAERQPEGPGNGFVLHHLGSGQARPVADVFDRIEAAFPNARLIRGARPRRPHEPAVQVAPDNGSSIVGWRPRVSWEDGMARTIAWWQRVSRG
jgi:nucleoside-diphosphate-sugar epimerase